MSLPPLDFETSSLAGFCFDPERQRWHGPPGASGSRKGLPVVGAAVYARHPSTDVLCASYADRQHWHPGLPNPQPLLDYVAAGGMLEAWNSGFEWWIWNEVCVRRYGWPPLRLEQLRCAMARSRAHGRPGSLELAADVAGTATRKDKRGRALLARFSMPRNPTKADPRTLIAPDWSGADPETLALGEYNHVDCQTEHEVASVTPELPPLELQHWLNDQRINRRGVAVDVASIEACCAIVEAALERYDAELVALTGCKSTELQKLIGWLHGQGVHTDSLDSDAVERLLAVPEPLPHVHRALTIRATVGSASVKKVFAMRLQESRGRLHDLYNFFGARTGRPTGEGPQPTNLPKAGPDVYRCGFAGKVPLPGGGCGRYFGSRRVGCPWCGVTRGPLSLKASEWNPGAVVDALEVIAWRSLDLLEHWFGDAMLAIAGCLRGLYVAAPGHTLVSSDFTAIEGVVIACLAGEQWRIDAYAADAPMYLLSAERMYGLSVEEMLAHQKATGQHHPRRQDGKYGELGLGFGGWIGALRGLGADGTDDELKAMVLKWRDASPAVVHFWGGQPSWKHLDYFGLEGMIVLALLNPERDYPVHRLDGSLTGISYRYSSADDALYCTVPSGGRITYHRPRMAPHDQGWRGQAISYGGYNTNPKQGPIGWVTMSLYGGKAAENVTQRVARDIQMHAIDAAERNDYPVVLHTYDEIVSEVPVGGGHTVTGLEALMCDVPVWARGWPIKAAGGWMADRYRKG